MCLTSARYRIRPKIAPCLPAHACAHACDRDHTIDLNPCETPARPGPESGGVPEFIERVAYAPDTFADLKLKGFTRR